MANHVHVLLTPHVEMRQVNRAVKSYSARKANQILGRTGEPFWQRSHMIIGSARMRR
jgi:REP element-mobilizing transposase RayT